MRANAAPLLAIFETKMQLEVPLFQRQYVWTQEQQWDPLWEDISRKFTEYLEGRKDSPVHFLGAMVIDQKQSPTGHVEKRQVIDGQQRLTTLQIFLAAFRDFSREHKAEDLATECELFTVNKGMMGDPAVDKFKVWPTQADRKLFSDVLQAGSKAAIDKLYPLIWRKYARAADPRPRIVAAYLFFYNQLTEFFLGSTTEPPLCSDKPLGARLEESFQALRNALQVVLIDLDQGDDAQVIFETLNARGEPLLPADLLRNFIFLRAARTGESQTELYEEFWKRFDDPFWRVEIKQGRLTRPRSDLFMQHFLASRQSVDIPVKHLFVEYKYWIEKSRPFASVRDEVQTLARQGEDFRRMVAPKKDDFISPFVTFLDRFDIRTAYPLLLALLDQRVTTDNWAQIATVLESYLVRRAVCGMTTKNYNRVFLNLTRVVRRDGYSEATIKKSLADAAGESTEWPADERFRTAWATTHAYQVLQNPKIVHILRRLNDLYYSNKDEGVSIEKPLTVEHIMPQSWLEHWPLSHGAKGLTMNELWLADAKDPVTVATRVRNAAVQTMGNLTILSQPLNTAVSNSAWKDKKDALMNASLLPINLQLQKFEVWNEETIELRSSALFEKALRIWPGPG